MPGIITQAIANTVLPYALCSAFTESYSWPVRISGPFADGSIITNLPLINGTAISASRRAWSIQQKLTETQRGLLADFYANRKGPQDAFYFYPLASQYDATGTLTAGRYLVRFDGPLSITQGTARNPTEFRLIQVQ